MSISLLFFFSSRRRHTRYWRDWSSNVCSSDLESNPPFRFSNVRGLVRILGDSVWLDLPHWDTPGSTGSAKGKVVWGSNLPVRYSIRVIGDSVSLNDVAWVYETLDRKSTRLNSSHANISYAVFCLKKKDET